MMRNPSTPDVDIAVLGSGASGTHGLLRTISELRDRRSSFDDPIRITVIDRDEQFHSGIPYGHRSGRSSLLISALESFLPDRERSDFIDWLEARRPDMLDWAKDGRTPDSPLATLMDRDWILRHEDAVRAGEWDDLYLPRRLYGQYLSELVERTFEEARGHVEVDFVHADVNEVTSEASGGVHLRERDSDGGIRFELHAHSLLLAVGSPPVRNLAVSAAKHPSTDDLLDMGLVADIHAPEIEHVIERIRGRLEALPVEKRTILLIGGNADALEFLLASHRLRQETGARLFILSSRGRPHYWHHDRPGERASTPILDRLFATAEAGTPLRARDLHEAVRAELSAAMTQKNVNSTIAALIAAVGSSLRYMDDFELYSMATDHGVAISDLLRRAGGDSLDFLTAGINDGSITCIPGRFREAQVREDMLFAVVDQLPGAAPDPGGDADHGYAVIVNGTGFERVTDTRSPLLRQMLGSGTVRASASRTGLSLDAKFQAAPGVFVLGPLIAGHHHGKAAYWHIESVARIIQLAGPVADSLVTETLVKRSMSAYLPAS
ncbi:FAD/NAD(P)-binding protein [Brevibacterium zhoupengii]|uniref:FAD/NAD(P)-binding protein n=1 Tax=Brevibacterium zhoupengii TaxID=2898795 RepID=UPI001E4E2A55|nr:FAD/NAD(P)-binding protein [Brevibacterium zhoupengii]